MWFRNHGVVRVSVAVLAFAAGYAFHFVVTNVDRRLPAIEFSDVTIADHWDRVREYHEFMQDPDNEQDIDGMTAVVDAPEPELSLAVLLAADELEYCEVILPAVPRGRDFMWRWEEFVNSNEDIIYSSGNSYHGFEITGEPPLHLRFWYTTRHGRGNRIPIAWQKIQDFIHDLEALPKDEVDPAQ